MESRIYKFHLDRVTVYWTIAHVVGFVLAALLLYILYVGGLFSAWFVLLILALVVLMILSMPRRIELSAHSLVVDSVLDVTEIPLDRIASVRKISPREIRWVLPIFGGCGFLGYYGHFFDFKHFRRINIYATEWRYLVEIVDIFDEHYYISCRERDDLISNLTVNS